jgi:hypothetical protein
MWWNRRAGIRGTGAWWYRGTGSVWLAALALLGAGGACDGAGEPTASAAEQPLRSSKRVCQPIEVPPRVDPDTGVQCHASRCTPGFCAREDIAPLSTNAKTAALQERLVTLDCSPHSVSPVTIFAEADPAAGGQSRLFQYYLLDSKGFEPSVFTTRIPGINDNPETQKTVWGANCNLPTIGAVRLALEPKPDLPTDPDDPRAFIDIFTDIRGLFVINNESGWYEGWMIHDLRVAPVDVDKDGRPNVGGITPDDARLLAAMGEGNNAHPGKYFTVDGKKPHFPSPDDHFPDKVSNVVPINLSMGAYNSLQQSDAHSYWEFNYTTNWIHPLFELPVTGGFPDRSTTEPADTFRDGEIGRKSSVVPGDTLNLNLDRRRAVAFGDNPSRPRDPDLFESGDDTPEQREFRQRFIPSGLAREVLLDVYQRLASFEPGEHNLERRLFAAYKAAIALADTNGDGIISALEGDIDTPNPHCPDGLNTCLFLVPRSYDRFAVTREINDGLLAPRFAPSTRGWALSGNIVTGFPVIGTSVSEDSDDR